MCYFNLKNQWGDGCVGLWYGHDLLCLKFMERERELFVVLFCLWRRVRIHESRELRQIDGLRDCKALWGTRIFISLNGDFDIEDAVYLKDFFGVGSLGDDCLVDWQRFSGATKTKDVRNLTEKMSAGGRWWIVVSNVSGNSFNDNFMGAIGGKFEGMKFCFKGEKGFLD